MHELCAAVREMGCSAEWLDLLVREIGLLMALCRIAAEERRAEREAAKIDLTGEVTT